MEKRTASDQPDDEAPPAKMMRFKPQESTAGIYEYMSDKKRPSFTARLKSRPFDFIVKEIDPDGNIVQLNSLENPVKEDDTGTKGLDGDLKEQLDELVANEDIQAKVRVDVTPMSKEQRTLIHVSVRNGYPSLQSETKDEGAVKLIEITKKIAHKGERFRYYWPNGRPNHTTFVLYKDNVDTMEAINAIAALTRVKPSTFSYAGTKDKRAVTTQLVSIYRMKPEYLLGINKRNEKFKIGNVRFGEKQIQLGDLKGNRFILTLRDVRGGSSEQIKSALEDLRDGFINYFGLQRFGTTSIPTHDIGKKMLAGKWEDACDLILRAREGGRPRKDLDAARLQWMENRDAVRCFDLLTTRGSQTSLEGHLLAALKKDPRNYQSALFGLQKNTRLLYIHGYQSYIWNSVVSRRVAKFGRKLLVGDLVLKEGDGNSEKSPVKIVTEENLSDYTIWDIVLPLPGFAVKYPENEQADWYREIVKADGFDDLNCFESRNRSFSMRGSYRKVFCLPEDFEYEIKTYTDPEISFVKTDWDVMLENDENLRQLEERKIQIKHERREREKAQKLENGETVYERKETPKQDTCNEEKIAVILSFSLPVCSYATMFLREFLKSNSENNVDPDDEDVADKVS